MGIDVWLEVANAAAQVTSAAVQANAAKKEAKAQEKMAIAQAEANRGPSAEELAQQREKERVKAMGFKSLLGHNQSVLGGWGEEASPSYSRSSLLGN